MKEVPKILHQIWMGKENPLPDFFKALAETWKRDYPTWQYEFWDDDRVNSFISENYPQYLDLFNRFPYDIQRCDAIRYLILDKIGGMYVDFDYESLEPIDVLIKHQTCCFAGEPQSHCEIFSKKIMFNNALMLSIPEHHFIKKIINQIFTEENCAYYTGSKFTDVLSTTGPWKLIDIYESASEKEKESVYLIPDQFVTPFNVIQIKSVKTGIVNEELESCLQNAYALHYFWGTWNDIQ